MTDDELLERAEYAVRFLKDRYSWLRADEYLEFANIITGKTRMDIMTPYQLYSICTVIRKSFKYNRKSYPFGNLTFEIFNRDGEQITRKSEDFKRVDFSNGIVIKEIWHQEEGAHCTTHYFRWEWGVVPDNGDLALMKLHVPIPLMKYL